MNIKKKYTHKLILNNLKNKQSRKNRYRSNQIIRPVVGFGQHNNIIGGASPAPVNQPIQLDDSEDFKSMLNHFRTTNQFIEEGGTQTLNGHQMVVILNNNNKCETLKLNLSKIQEGVQKNLDSLKSSQERMEGGGEDTHPGEIELKAAKAVLDKYAKHLNGEADKNQKKQIKVKLGECKNELQEKKSKDNYVTQQLLDVQKTKLKEILLSEVDPVKRAVMKLTGEKELLVADLKAKKVEEEKECEGKKDDVGCKKIPRKDVIKGLKQKAEELKLQEKEKPKVIEKIETELKNILEEIEKKYDKGWKTRRIPINIRQKAYDAYKKRLESSVKSNTAAITRQLGNLFRTARDTGQKAAQNIPKDSSVLQVADQLRLRALGKLGNRFPSMNKSGQTPSSGTDPTTNTDGPNATNSDPSSSSSEPPSGTNTGNSDQTSQGSNSSTNNDDPEAASPETNAESSSSSKDDDNIYYFDLTEIKKVEGFNYFKISFDRLDLNKDDPLSKSFVYVKKKGDNYQIFGGNCNFIIGKVIHREHGLIISSSSSSNQASTSTTNNDGGQATGSENNASTTQGGGGVSFPVDIDTKRSQMTEKRNKLNEVRLEFNKLVKEIKEKEDAQGEQMLDAMPSDGEPSKLTEWFNKFQAFNSKRLVGSGSAFLEKARNLYEQAKQKLSSSGTDAQGANTQGADAQVANAQVANAQVVSAQAGPSILAQENNSKPPLQAPALTPSVLAAPSQGSSSSSAPASGEGDSAGGDLETRVKQLELKLGSIKNQLGIEPADSDKCINVTIPDFNTESITEKDNTDAQIKHQNMVKLSRVIRMMDSNEQSNTLYRFIKGSDNQYEWVPTGDAGSSLCNFDLLLQRLLILSALPLNNKEKTLFNAILDNFNNTNDNYSSGSSNTTPTKLSVLMDTFKISN